MKEQFLAAYTTHTDALFRYCLFKVSDREVAKDLVQDVFVKTWTYITKGNDITNFKPFLYRSLHNTIIDYYRKHTSISLDMLEESGFDAAYEDAISGEDMIDGEKAIALLSRLPKEYKEVLFMKYVEDLSLSEIADITGELENTIAVRIHRGMKKLKELYPDTI